MGVIFFSKGKYVFRCILQKCFVNISLSWKHLLRSLFPFLRCAYVKFEKEISFSYVESD